MKKSKLALFVLSLAITAVFMLSCSNDQKDKEEIGSRLKATGEVTLSGSTWTAKVDGVTKYTGTDMFAACNAAIAAMSSGTVNLRASGNSGASGGVVKAINLKSNITFNGNGYTINANTTDHLIVPIQADRKSTIAVRNLRITGAPRYALWIKGCSGITLSGITCEMSNGWLGVRIDNSTAATSRANIGDVIVKGGSMGVETYGLDGLTAGKITAWHNTQCGVCLNQTKNSTINYVDAYYCNYGGGYAGYRVANSAGPNNYVGTVNSNYCGRGFFSVTSSNGTTINYLNAQNCSSHGALIENAQNTKINSGWIYNNGSHGVRFSSTLSYGCKYNLVQGINTNDGICETSPCDYNTVKNCRLNGSGLTISGSHSVSTGNTL